MLAIWEVQVQVQEEVLAVLGMDDDRSLHKPKEHKLCQALQEESYTHGYISSTFFSNPVQIPPHKSSTQNMQPVHIHMYATCMESQ
jgi:hypothetical protein